mgnify:FL=1
MRTIIARAGQVPMLVITILSAVPVAVLWDLRVLPAVGSLVNPPSVGQLIVALVVVATVVPMLVEAASDLLHGKAGVDVLAIMALVSTLLVGEYWASWAVALMVWSGDAIERYANGRAASSLNALVAAAPRQAHVVTLRGVGSS